MKPPKYVMSVVLALALALSAVVPLAAQDDCAPGVDYASRAQSRLSEGQFDSAIDAFTCLIEMDGRDVDARLGRAVAAIQKAALEGEISFTIVSDLSIVWEEDPELIADAVDDATAALNTDPQDIGALAVRGLLNWYNWNSAEAVEDFNSLLQEDPDNAFALVFRGAAQQNLGNIAKAEADFRRAVDTDPENAGIHALIGALLETDDPTEQLAYYERAIELDPDTAYYYRLRAFAYYALEDYEAALSDFDRAIELEPDNPNAYVDRAFAHQDLGDDEAALADFTQAIELDPDYQYAYQSRGWAYITAGDYEAAIEDFEIALELDEDDRWSYLGRATAQLEIGEIAASAQDYATYVELTEAFRFDGPNLRYGRSESVPMSEGNVYYLPLQAQSGDVLTITALADTPEVDPLVLLLAPDGTPLAGNDDIDAASGNYSAQIPAFEIPRSGTYTVVVTHAGGGSTGTVTISVESGTKL